MSISKNVNKLVVLGEGPLAKIAAEYASLANNWREIDIVSFNPNEKGISIFNLNPTDNEQFVCAFYDIESRIKAITAIESKGGKFTNIIHPSANVHSLAKIGVGNIIGAFVTLSTDVFIGNHVFIQDQCNIGHDSKIGDYCHLFVGCTLSGLNSISERSMLFTRCLIYPKVKVGTECVVAAASVVMRKVKDGDTVMGNPAAKVEI